MTPREQRIDDYRSGYSAGWSDGKNGAPMEDSRKAALFFGQQVPAHLREPDPECICCGSRLAVCECPAETPHE